MIYLVTHKLKDKNISGLSFGATQFLVLDGLGFDIGFEIVERERLGFYNSDLVLS